MRVVSLVRYPISLKHDLGVTKINAYFGNGIIGDGVTDISSKEWNSAYKCNKTFLDRCNSKGTITWSEFHAEKTKEAKKIKEPVVVEEVKEESVPAEKETASEELNKFLEG